MRTGQGGTGGVRAGGVWTHRLVTGQRWGGPATLGIPAFYTARVGRAALSGPSALNRPYRRGHSVARTTRANPAPARRVQQQERWAQRSRPIAAADVRGLLSE